MDAAAAALAQMMAVFARGSATGWARESDGVTAMVTGFPDPMLNAVLAVRRTGQEAELLREVAATGLPYCLETRTAEPVEGMSAVASVPVMVLEDAALLAPGDLAIRALGAGEIDLHLSCLAASVGVPRDYFAPLDGGELLAEPGVTAYLAGDGVATGVGIVAGGYVGVFNMGTPPDHRRQGYGAAVASRIVLDGLAAGAGGAVLQSSALRRGVYEGLGFRVAEEWTVWVPGDS